MDPAGDDVIGVKQRFLGQSFDVVVVELVEEPVAIPANLHEPGEP